MTRFDTPQTAPAVHLPDVKVWDAPVRMFHWLLVASFTGAYLTAEGEAWRLVHITLGYTAGGLLIFRILWGLVGTRYARFSNFVRGPSAVVAYTRSMFKGQPDHHTGHNPAGAIAILLIMLLGLSQLATGWAIYNDIGGEWLEELHELSGNGMLAVVAVHILGVVVASVQHRTNLARAMVTGNKPGLPQDAIRRTWPALAAVILVAVLAFWAYQWHQAPVAQVGAAADVQAVADKDHDKD